MKRVSIQHMQDEDGRTITKIMDQYEFVCRSGSDDIAVTPDYILSAQVGGGFVVQKHYIDGAGREQLLYYKGRAVAPATPRTVFESDMETLDYSDVWEAFA